MKRKQIGLRYNPRCTWRYDRGRGSGCYTCPDHGDLRGVGVVTYRDNMPHCLKCQNGTSAPTRHANEAQAAPTSLKTPRD